MNTAAIASLHQLSYEYVKDDISLRQLCNRLADAEIITLDTEFVRTRTLKPQLGLLQVFDGSCLALIDPILINDLSAFINILINPNIIKVLHSCSEDIEALHSNLGVVPTPLFDTQFAASLLGKGASIGYANMIETFFSVVLDKGESRTDWMARPLSVKQLEYAAADVTYLMAAYDELSAELDTRNLTHCVFAESEGLIKKKTQPFPSEFAYLTLSNNWKLSGKNLFALKCLAQWRMDLARSEDIAINFVIKEASMLEIAMKLPQSSAQLHQLHGLFGKQIRLYADDILRIVDDAKHAQAEMFPPKPERLIEFQAYKKATADIKLIVEKLAVQTDIPSAVLASKKQMGQLLKWCWFALDETELQGLSPDLISGWRRALFLDSLQPLFGREGRYEALRGL